MPDALPDSFLTEAMRQACQTARAWMGATSPNPPVGAAALDAKGRVLALAAHRRAGEDHAERALLKICRDQGVIERISTVCVTLEPCNHQGKTPPCCDALIEAKIRRVAVGCRDPNLDVKGGGVERLRAAGIEVVEGIETEACRRLIHAFAFYALEKKPFVTVKRAFDERGSMIPQKGQKTFTSHESLVLAHRLRKKADALVTGSGTVLADTPLFTVRHVKDHDGKRRILAILDPEGRVPESYIKEATKNGFDVTLYKDIDDCFSDIARRGAQDVLVEAGPTLSGAILKSPHWTMGVDIYKGSGKDDVRLSFNEAAKIPFNIGGIALEDLLPD